MTIATQEWKGKGLKVHATTADVTTAEGREALVKEVSIRIAVGRYGGGFVHGRSRVTIDPRIPAMSGWSTSGFTDQTDIACAKREAP